MNKEETKQNTAEEKFRIELAEDVRALFDAGDETVRLEVYRLKDLLEEVTQLFRDCIQAAKNTTKSKKFIEQFEFAYSDFCGLRTVSMEHIAELAEGLRTENYGRAFATQKLLRVALQSAERVQAKLSNVRSNIVGEQDGK